MNRHAGRWCEDKTVETKRNKRSTIFTDMREDGVKANAENRNSGRKYANDIRTDGA